MWSSRWFNIWKCTLWLTSPTINLKIRTEHPTKLDQTSDLQHLFLLTRSAGSPALRAASRQGQGLWQGLGQWDPGSWQGSYVNEGCDSSPLRTHTCAYTDMQLLILLQEWEWAVSVHDSQQRGVYPGTWGGRFAHCCFVFSFVTEFVIWEQFQSFLWNTDMQHLMCLESVAQHVGRLLGVYSVECCWSVYFRCL